MHGNTARPFGCCFAVLPCELGKGVTPRCIPPKRAAGMSETVPPVTRPGTETRQRGHVLQVRCTDDERAGIVAAAERAGLTVGAFMRQQSLGTPGPRAARRPVVARVELAQVLGQLGKWGSNVNQLARAYNVDGSTPAAVELAAIRAELVTMREALMGALGRGD